MMNTDTLPVAKAAKILDAFYTLSVLLIDADAELSNDLHKIARSGQESTESIQEDVVSAFSNAMAGDKFSFLSTNLNDLIVDQVREAAEDDHARDEHINEIRNTY
jgi:hypothetical protein